MTPTAGRVRRAVARSAVGVLVALAGAAGLEPAQAATTTSVTVAAGRGYAGYCVDGGVTVDVSVWTPAHTEVLRCAPDVTAADSTFAVLRAAGIVIDGQARLTAPPAESGWTYYAYTPTPGQPVPGHWDQQSATSLSAPHPATAHLRWWFGGAQPSRYPPVPVPTTGTLSVGVSDAYPAPGAQIRIWVAGTLWLEQVRVRVGGVTVSPKTYQSGIANQTPFLAVQVPAQAGPLVVKATGATTGRAGKVTLQVGGTPPASAPNPAPSLVSVWQPCQRNKGVTEIVDFSSLGDGDVEVRCAAFRNGETAGELTGAIALTRAGFGLEGTAQFGDAAVCRLIDHADIARPTPTQNSCYRMPGASAYWSYWHAEPGTAWTFASTGVSGTATSVEGWSFSTTAGTTVAPRLAAQDARGLSR